MKKLIALLIFILLQPAVTGAKAMDHHARLSNKQGEPDSAAWHKGAVRAEIHGQGPIPLIFIPGLASGAWAWDDMVRRFSITHKVYALTLAGFSGLPSQPSPIIDKVVRDIRRLIREEKLERPVLIGHSLGAFIAYRIGVDAPEEIGGVIALDGFPVFSKLADADAAERQAAAEKLANELGRNKTPETFKAAMHNFLSTRITDPAKVDAITERVIVSDPAAVAQYVMEMLPVDLRPQLHLLKAPVLAVVATNSYKNGLPDADIRAFYAHMLQAIPDVEITLIHDARHFVAVDQPDKVAEAIEKFLNARFQF
ncbi:MAG: hypothetical protein DCC73_13725 [Proteobacteria bacterium]|nr:MAG: hypothetical protein DCC73_13725 [Pseudomonadota bacterium]